MAVSFLKLTLLCALVSVCQFCFSQELFICHGIKMPADSVAARVVTTTLSLFLRSKAKPNTENAYVLQSEFLPTYCLLDELKGMDDYEGSPKEKDYYQCQLTSMVQMDTDKFLLQISYLSGKGGVASLHGSFRLLAKRVDGKFYICSPLNQNTGDWKTKTYGLLTCHYKTNSNVNDGKALQAIITAYNQKLGIPNGPVVIYTFNNSIEAQQALGIDYKLEYNGVKDDWFSDHGNNAAIVLASDPQYPHGFDAHDLWHERLHMVMDRGIINRPVDEGCAYLYGGSWGYSAAEVMAMFKQYAAANPNADWL